MLLLAFGQSEKEKGKSVFSILTPSFSVFYLNVFFLLITFRHLLKFQFILTSVKSCWSSPSRYITVENASLLRLCHIHCLPLCVALLLFPVSPNTSAILLGPETGNSRGLHILLLVVYPISHFPLYHISGYCFTSPHISWETL